MENKDNNKEKTEFEKYLESFSKPESSEEDTDTEINTILSRAGFKKKPSEEKADRNKLFPVFFYKNSFRYAFAAIILIAAGLVLYFYIYNSGKEHKIETFVKTIPELSEPEKQPVYKDTNQIKAPGKDKIEVVLLASVELYAKNRGSNDSKLIPEKMARNSLMIAADVLNNRKIKFNKPDSSEIITEWYSNSENKSQKFRLHIITKLKGQKINIYLDKTGMQTKEYPTNDLTAIAKIIRSRIEEYILMAE